MAEVTLVSCVKNFYDWLLEKYQMSKDDFNKLKNYKKVSFTKEWLKKYRY